MEDFYQSLADYINQTLSRKAISARKIDALVREAKRIRQQQGLMGLWNFASQLPARFFTESRNRAFKAISRMVYFYTSLYTDFDSGRCDYTMGSQNDGAIYLMIVK